MLSLQLQPRIKNYPNPKSRFSPMEHVSPIAHHIQEIRIRSFYLASSVFLTFCTCYYYSEELSYFLATPLIETHLKTTASYIYIPSEIKLTSFIYTDMKEVFFTYIGISIYISCLFFLPVFFFHLLHFFSPGLYVFEKKQWVYYFISSILLFLSGCFFAYQILLPWLYEFFVSFETNNPDSEKLFKISLQPKIQEYFFFSIRLILFSGLLFQLPLFLWVLLSTNILPDKVNAWILQKRNIAYLFFFFFSAWISPPDIRSQLILAIPWILVYEFTIFLIIWRRQYLKFYINLKKHAPKRSF